MLLRLLEAAAGIVLALSVLRDVFDTVVVPGRVHGPLRVLRRLVLRTLPLSKRLHRHGISVNFAPMMLVAAFFSWMLLLMLAFALLLLAVGDTFQPALAGFGDAFYVAGSAMTTIGVGPGQPHGIARVLAVGAGLCGLAVLTLAVTYLLQVQNSIGQRDIGVLQLTTTVGRPPCAIALLERYAELECRDELADVLRHARDWCATVLQSHVSHPSLIYFRSAGTASGWPSTLGTLADLALLHEHVLADRQLRGLGVLLREETDRLSRALGELLGLDPLPPSAGAADVHAVCERLRAAGYCVREDLDVAGFLAARHAATGGIDALSRHLGNTPAPLVPAITASSPPPP